MKTHLEIDEQLLSEAMQRGRHSTKRAAVNAALAEYVNFCKRLELLSLHGKVRWEGDLDQMRKSRVP
jgi:Arc/MetJ family transcription regulator